MMDDIDPQKASRGLHMISIDELNEVISAWQTKPDHAHLRWGQYLMNEFHVRLVELGLAMPNPMIYYSTDTPITVTRMFIDAYCEGGETWVRDNVESE